jgi:uncharacterized protein YjbK
MHQQIEAELKWALRPDGHDRLLAELRQLLHPLDVLNQQNWFFDTRDARLRAQRMNVRVRTQADRIVVTCKRKLTHSDAQGLHRHDEWEQDIDERLWRQVIDDAGDPARLLPMPPLVKAALAGAPLVSLGGFANQRHEGHDHVGGRVDLICLDRTVFPAGGIDHELEIETQDALQAAQRWADLLRGWGIAYHIQPLTKFARFLAHAQPTQDPATPV